jgi:hypothetical protein
MPPSKLDNLLHNFKLKGKANRVFLMISLLATTQTITSDKSFWSYRGWVMANDRDRADPGWVWQRVN